MDFASRLSQLIAERETNKLQLSKDIGVSSSLLSAWEKGNKKPSFDNLLALADRFGVSIDYLAGRSEVRPAGPAAEMTKREVRLLNAFRQLNEDDQLIEVGRVEALADAMRKKQKHEGVG